MENVTTEIGLIRVAAVEYLNAIPLIYKLSDSPFRIPIDLILGYPARIALMLQNDEVDLGLVPVATIPLLNEHFIVSDYCIGGIGEVKSVCLFSDVPLNDIETVILDYQSRTSVALFKILCRHHWKIDPVMIDGKPGFENSIAGKTAAVVIGDRALLQRSRSKYIYDLGQAWQEMTGLPFVFAAWIANKKLPASFIEDFNAAIRAGLQFIPEIVKENSFPNYDLAEYYTKDISYHLDEEKRKGLAEFLRLLKQA